MTAIGVLLGLLVLVVLSLPGPAPSGAGSPVTAIIDVRLFDGTDFLEDATVILADGRVLAAGHDIEVPTGATVIDGRGRTALPGLIDAHAHVFGAAREDALRFGVTTLLDMFRMPMDSVQVRAERESLSATKRADLFSAGYLATVPGGHGTQFGFPVPTLNDTDPAEWVAARLEEGSDYIKIVIEDGSNWGRELPTLAPDTVRALVAAAHARGVLAVAHVSTYAAARMALDAGVDGLVHLFVDAPVDAQFIAAAQSAGAWIMPTATVLAASHGHSGAAELSEHPVLGARLSPMQAQTLGQAFPGTAARRDRWPMVLAGVRALHEAGVPLLAGSDAPNPGTAHGASLHHELALLVEAGLAPIAALRAATSNPARAFGLPDRGCLQPGCRADLLLLEGDPREDIDNTARIERIWKNGHPVMLKSSAARLR
ncbi:amidohydrolase family protein [Wenzhouxiangella sp. XN24]|uniref:amidohydrolase family protein n=1 Tax=Wenzhouxiangella sp. XN24 TaxID=2713569 RepID=UPI0013EAF1A2|nr:amidohydrolase family protein [Wenzhouxiangella sp. XN24]NGX16075.1 amidohydrolase family protein [Wenzhouxiangella sp. XN24]